MKRIAFFFAGFFLALLAETLFGSIAFASLAAAFSFGLYLLFFSRQTDAAWSLYLGLTVGAELLGSQRFGLYALHAYCGNLLVILFKEQLRFTSLEARFSLALFFSLMAYGLMFSASLLPLAGWIALALVFLATSGFALLRPTLSNEPAYEPI